MNSSSGGGAAVGRCGCEVGWTVCFPAGGRVGVLVVVDAKPVGAVPLRRRGGGHGVDLGATDGPGEGIGVNLPSRAALSPFLFGGVTLRSVLARCLRRRNMGTVKAAVVTAS